MAFGGAHLHHCDCMSLGGVTSDNVGISITDQSAAIMSPGMTLSSVQAILILSTEDGSRILAKYYSSPHNAQGGMYPSPRGDDLVVGNELICLDSGELDGIEQSLSRFKVSEGF